MQTKYRVVWSLNLVHNKIPGSMKSKFGTQQNSLKAKFDTQQKIVWSLNLVHTKIVLRLNLVHNKIPGSMKSKFGT